LTGVDARAFIGGADLKELGSLTRATAESDAATRTVLEACARGQPPSPWD
jgi:enoyl-CoA hydratase/carnithine racemase